jgi:hypothetical protein
MSRPEGGSLHECAGVSKANVNSLVLVGLGGDVRGRVKMRGQTLPKRGEFRLAGTVCLRLHASDDKKQGVPASDIP